jgi:hypothetical protein
MLSDTASIGLDKTGLKTLAVRQIGALGANEQYGSSRAVQNQ